MRNALMRAALGGYSFAWRVARPALRRNRRLADGFAERLLPPGWPGLGESLPNGRVDIWVQAASGGEARLACALLDALPALAGGAACTVLATTWTRQGRDILDAKARALSASPLRLIPRFVPFDDPALMRRALASARPRVVVLLETELWPGLLHACREAGVPVLVLNGRLTEKTARIYARTAGLWRALAPDRIVAMSAENTARFARIFPATPCETLPNIKFDLAAQAARLGVTSPDLPAVLGLGAGALRPLGLFASVREEEEQELCAVLGQLAAEGLFATQGGPAARLVIAPRHMHRVEAWTCHLARLGLHWTRRSCPDAGAAAADVIVWDAFGELAWLYAVADAVFVGGSLAPLGGQNFLEPLAAGVVPCVGPHLANFAWALDAPEGEGLAERDLLRRVPDGQALCRFLSATLTRGALTPAQRLETREHFYTWLAYRQGGTAAQAARLVAYLPDLHPLPPA